MKARLSDDRSEVRLAGERWGMTFSVTELPRWLAFYRGLMARRCPRNGTDYARHYGDTVAELERVAAEVTA